VGPLVTAEGALSRPVSVGGAEKPFGELTLAEVRARAAELREAAGWGPTARVAPVARAWADLARAMEAGGAGAVADLGGEAEAMAGRLWVVPPGGTLL
jgi:hypothetical protein